MIFTGSTATAHGGSMGMFDTRIYNYEPSLLYLQPPWFPTDQRLADDDPLPRAQHLEPA